MRSVQEKSIVGNAAIANWIIFGKWPSINLFFCDSWYLSNFIPEKNLNGTPTNLGSD
jgi:hypothetical protein